MIQEIIRNVQACVPFRLLKDKYLPLVLENRINPEIGIDAQVIDTYSRKDFTEMASLLQQEGLLITLHGPFYDLVPGGIDKKILKAISSYSSSQNSSHLDELDCDCKSRWHHSLEHEELSLLVHSDRRLG